jgi:UDP-glucose 4-epimerase
MKGLLVTGAAGYIGSHMCLELLRSGRSVVAVDNLCNGSMIALDRVRDITGEDIAFVPADLRDANALAGVFTDHEIGAVIHLAGLKSVGESVERPLDYYDNNVNGTFRLLQAMQTAGVRTLVFSSSATVYGYRTTGPIPESAPTEPVNPYGRTKLVIEDMLKTLSDADSRWRISILRYFNPAGADASGEIGESPNGVPNNLIPNIGWVTVGKRPVLKVFGNDYPTPDGTVVRDYIHVVDLVRGHLQALEQLRAGRRLSVYNLGRGRGYSVLEVVRAFEDASGLTIPYEIVGRRPGDVPEYCADTTKANRELNWRAEHGIRRMCEDAWRWYATHPDGYA